MRSQFALFASWMLQEVALFRFWIEVEETIILNLWSKPIQSNSSNFQDANRAIIVKKFLKTNSQSEKGTESQNYFRMQIEQFESI